MKHALVGWWLVVAGVGCTCGGEALLSDESRPGGAGPRDAGGVIALDGGTPSSTSDGGLTAPPSVDAGRHDADAGVGRACQNDTECPTGWHCEGQGELGGTCVENPPVCAPTTCAAQQRTCGHLDDTCGGALTCGTCASCADTAAQFRNHTTTEEFVEPSQCPTCPGAFSGFGQLGGTLSTNATTVALDGTAPNADTCCWEVQSTSGGLTAGSATPDASGRVSTTLPVFCGHNTVRLMCSNASGERVLVREVEAPCAPRDLRVTLAWDDQGSDMELHLVKAGGRINTPQDCTWYTCVGAPANWSSVPESNPRKDVDNVRYFGPENIYLQTAEATAYHVLVEYWGNGAPSRNDVTVTVREQTVATVTRVLDLHSVWYVGTVTFPSGVFLPADTATACASNWRGTSMGCDLALPTP